MLWKTEPSYRYRAELDRVVDGDTLDVLIDLGFYIRIKERREEACRERKSNDNRDTQNRQMASVLAKVYLPDTRRTQNEELVEKGLEGGLKNEALNTEKCGR